MMLSNRLQAVKNLVSPCEVAADIGCDHAYLAIELVRDHIAKRVIATDINAGPLKIAAEHIREAGLENCITTIQCDGITGIYADTIIICGMGGKLMLRILTDSLKELEHATTLILQPQSEIAQFRNGLCELGFEIVDEDFVIEDGKYYPMMKAQKGQMFLNDITATYGPVLLKKKHPDLKVFLKQQNAYLTDLLEELKRFSSEKSMKRIDQIAEELQLNEKALRLIETET